MLEDANKRLIEMQAEQLKLSAALYSVLERLAEKEPKASDLLEQYAQMQVLNSVGSGNSQSSQEIRATNVIEISQKTVASPKLEFAIDWLKANPQDRKKSGRELETSVLMNGETISYKWWNKAKAE